LVARTWSNRSVRTVFRKASEEAVTTPNTASPVRSPFANAETKLALRRPLCKKCRTPLEACRERIPMIEKTTQSVVNLGYHAHIYYDPTRTRAVAEHVCAAVGEKFRVEIDGFRDMPVGPHPIANALVIFKPDQFEHVVPYLMLNRAGLDVLVHPLTEDAVADHSSYAIWLGYPVELKLHALPRGRGGRLPSGVSA
jgi:aromatic ring-cleaving dioxygenase